MNLKKGRKEQIDLIYPACNHTEIQNIATYVREKRFKPLSTHYDLLQFFMHFFSVTPMQIKGYT